MSLISGLECWFNLAVFRLVRRLLHRPNHQDARSLFLADLCDPDNHPKVFFLQKYRKTSKSKTPDTVVLPGTWRFAEMVWRSYGIELPGFVLSVASFAFIVLLLLRVFVTSARFILYPNDVVAERIAEGKGTISVWVIGIIMFIVPLALIMTIQVRRMFQENMSVNDAVKYLKEQEEARKQALTNANWFIALSLFFGNFLIRLIFYRFWDPGHDFFFDVVASILSVAWCACVALESLNGGPSRLTTIFLTVSNLLHLPLSFLLRGLRSLCFTRAIVLPVFIVSVVAFAILLLTGLIPALLCKYCYEHYDEIKQHEIALGTRAFRSVFRSAHLKERPLEVDISKENPSIEGLVVQLPSPQFLLRNVCLSVKLGDSPPKHQPMATYSKTGNYFTFPPIELDDDFVQALVSEKKCQILLTLRDKPTGLAVKEVLYNLVLPKDDSSD